MFQPAANPGSKPAKPNDLRAELTHITFYRDHCLTFFLSSRGLLPLLVYILPWRPVHLPRQTKRYSARTWDLPGVCRQFAIFHYSLPQRTGESTSYNGLCNLIGMHLHIYRIFIDGQQNHSEFGAIM